MKCPANERQGDRPCLFFWVSSPDTPLFIVACNSSSHLSLLIVYVCFVLNSLCLLQCACVKMDRQCFSFLPNSCTVNRYILAWKYLFCLDAHYKLPFTHSFKPRGASCCLDNTIGFTTCYLGNAGFTAWRGHYRLIPTVAGDWGPWTMPLSPCPSLLLFPNASHVIFDSNPRTEKAMSFLSFLAHLFSSAFFFWIWICTLQGPFLQWSWESAMQIQKIDIERIVCVVPFYSPYFKYLKTG